jgi:SHS2 domain-containing protein
MVDNGFRFLEHMTDAEIEAYGKDINEAFENAGKAVEDLMVDLASISPVEERMVELESKDLGSLLYQWIESLISLQDSEGMLFSKFDCDVSRIPEKYTLRAKLFGEKFDAKKHEQKTAVKAPTFHDMKISEREGNVTMRFLVDL